MEEDEAGSLAPGRSPRRQEKGMSQVTEGDAPMEKSEERRETEGEQAIEAKATRAVLEVSQEEID